MASHARCQLPKPRVPNAELRGFGDDRAIRSKLSLPAPSPTNEPGLTRVPQIAARGHLLCELQPFACAAAARFRTEPIHSSSRGLLVEPRLLLTWLRGNAAAFDKELRRNVSDTRADAARVEASDVYRDSG